MEELGYVNCWALMQEDSSSALERDREKEKANVMEKDRSES